MKRIGWIAMLLGVVLVFAGCGKPEEKQPPPAVEVPEVPENVDADKVTGAVGKALLKGISGGAESEPGQPDPETP